MKVEIMDNRTVVEFKDIAVGECFQASANLDQPFMKVKEIAGVKRNCVNLTTGTLFYLSEDKTVLRLDATISIRL